MFAPGAGHVTTAEYGVQRSQYSTAWLRETLVDGETVLNVDTVEDIGRAALAAMRCESYYTSTIQPLGASISVARPACRRRRRPPRA